LSEGSNGVTDNKGRGGVVPGGVVDRGAHGRDDLVNWEILTIPYQDSGGTESR
jgi:hypothetical protein